MLIAKNGFLNIDRVSANMVIIGVLEFRMFHIVSVTIVYLAQRMKEFRLVMKTPVFHTVVSITRAVTDISDITAPSNSTFNPTFHLRIYMIDPRNGKKEMHSLSRQFFVVLLLLFVKLLLENIV